MPENPDNPRGGSELFGDCAFLALVSALSSFLSMPRLGFYSDDWAFLASFRFAADQSFWGLYRTFNAENGTYARPLQGLGDVLLYRLFGQNPLGYHAAITLAFLFGLCVLYCALRNLWVSRLMALSIVLVFGLLPQYSTVRLWFATTQITLSMVFYFLAVYGDTRYVRAVQGWGWFVLSSLCLILSGLAYEAFLPLFLVNPVVMALGQFKFIHGGQKSRRSRVEWWLFSLRNVPLIGLILWFKFLITPNRARRLGFSIVNAYQAAVDLVFGAYGARLPRVLGAIRGHYWDMPTCMMTMAIVLSVAAYLAWASRGHRAQVPAASMLVVMLAAGFVLSGLTYAYFWDGFGFGTGVNIGVNNRVAVAASVPVAVSIVGLMGLLSVAGGRGMRSNVLFSILIALCCGCAYWIDETIASFWIEASHHQAVILGEISHAIPTVPKKTSILLDGFCPWVGPGIVFETVWDVTGALDLVYNDRSLKGDVLRPKMTITDSAVMDLDGQSPYSFTSLYFYDAGKKEAVRIADRESAIRYQQQSAQDPRNACIADETLSGFGTPVW
jgi:hypothetical protein